MASSGQRYAYAAAWLRTVMGALALAMGPALDIELGGLRWALLAYIGAALFEQRLISRGNVGEFRATLGGILDIAILALVTHRFGTTGSPLVGLFMLIPLIHGLVASPRVAWALAALSVVTYSALLTVVHIGLLGEPARSNWSHLPAAVGEVVAPVFVMVPLVLLTTGVTVKLTREIVDRQGALVRANARLAAMNRRDPLTQLFNRRHLIERLELELARVRRGHKLALLMIDLDGFKAVNDGLGHLAGDDALKATATALQDAVRETDLVGRYGGDEFVALVVDASAKEVGVVAERLRVAVAAAGLIDDDHRVTASIGVAVADDKDEAASLIRRADANTYRAKSEGRDRVVGDES